MQAYRLVSVALGVTLTVSGLAVVQAQRGARGTQTAEPVPPSTLPPAPTFRLPGAPSPTVGASVTPALEGWYPNPDGTFTILAGYRNRNQTQQIEVPIGPNNKIEPGGPYDQPTHFDTGRHYGVFSIIVPRDFGTKRLAYTINVNNQPQTILLGLPRGYQIEPFLRNDTGNTPPTVKLDAEGAEYTGPPRGAAKTFTAKVDEPVTLTLYATDTGNTINQSGTAAEPAAAAGGVRPNGARGGVTVRWYKHRGPGTDSLKLNPATSPVAADPEVAKMFKKAGTSTGKATTAATFTEPGEYWVRAQISDGSQMDEQCCWSTVLIKVNVQAP
jgi:hypothetical protein